MICHANQLADGTNVVYFRGRKLQGKAVALPEKYRGVMLEREAKPENRPISEESMEVVTIEDNDEIERQTFRTTAEFDEVMVWGHETIADATGDPYVRSVEEWLTVADQVCRCALGFMPCADNCRFIHIRRRMRRLHREMVGCEATSLGTRALSLFPGGRKLTISLHIIGREIEPSRAKESWWVGTHHCHEKGPLQGHQFQDYSVLPSAAGKQRWSLTSAISVHQ
jgi:hypothetical protein